MRVALAALSGTLIYLLVGWVVFEKLLGRYMAATTTDIAGFKKAEADSSALMLVVSCFAYAVLLTVVFEYWAQVRTTRDGLVLGSFIGLVVAVMTNTYWYSTSHFFKSLAPVFVDVVAAGLTVGVMGGLIGWVLGYSSR